MSKRGAGGCGRVRVAVRWRVLEAESELGRKEERKGRFWIVDWGVEVIGEIEVVDLVVRRLLLLFVGWWEMPLDKIDVESERCAARGMDATRLWRLRGIGGRIIVDVKCAMQCGGGIRSISVVGLGRG